MRAWYVPSWNGDLRLQPVTNSEGCTRLLIEKPTPHEQIVVNALGEEFVKRGWLASWTPLSYKGGFFRRRKWDFVIAAPLEQVGPVVTGIMRPGPAVLTAVLLGNGRIITTSEGPSELATVAGEIEDEHRKAQAVADEAERKVRDAAEAERERARADADKKAQEAREKEAKAAATVRRPTPSCPQCVPGAIKPASEVLLSFLSEAEHESWSRDRTLVVQGGLSGHRYLLAHRHTAIAQKMGRCCYDLDANLVVHFHDWRVPPEEEILAAKLILEHREPWLRNEATMLGAAHSVLSFKNPFGGGGDGIWDAGLTQGLGRSVELFGHL